MLTIQKEESKESRGDPIVEFRGLDPLEFEAQSNPRKESIYDKTAKGLELKNKQNQVK